MSRARKWLLGIICLGLVASGCASSGLQQAQLQQSQLQSQTKKQDLNQIILTKGAQSAGTGFRDYQVGPEDLLEIQVFDQDDLTRTVRVNGQGEIGIPLVGTVKVQGLTPQQVELRLKELYGTRFLQNPQVTVFVKEYRHQRVAVTGALKNPGYFEMIGPRNLMEMLAMAGGVTDDKAGDVVYIIRQKGTAAKVSSTSVQPFAPNSETIVIDLRRLVKEGAVDLNIPIQHGDVIHVPFAPNAYVLGAVNKPGNVPLKGNLTVSQAVAMAGGTQTFLASPGGTTILRLDEQGQTVTLKANLKAIIAKSEPDIPLKENDVVFVPEGPIQKFILTLRQLTGGGMTVGYAVAP